MNTALADIENRRQALSQSTNPNHKFALAQFMTPMRIAQFMARLMPVPKSGTISILDPGAGIGSLSSAFLERVLRVRCSASECEVAAYEIDKALHAELKQSLQSFGNVNFEIIEGDFISQAVFEYFLAYPRFTHAILNPPYKKIHSKSNYRRLLRTVGIETVNLYSSFVALSLAMLKANGHLVAIIPRSFCNGPYYRPFRNILLSDAAIHHIHIFEKRNSAFKGDEVLQENIIIHLEKHGKQGDVTVSRSQDAQFSNFSSRVLPFSALLREDNPEKFIYIPDECGEMNLPPCAVYSLNNLDIEVSTGPLVDFRLTPHLRKEAEAGTVPLLYPAHCTKYGILWPKRDFKKHNAIARNSATQKWLFPKGYYTVVKRFSAKEERRRVSAYILSPQDIPHAEFIGIENHLNVFHYKKQGINSEFAFGLTAYLNSTTVDKYFRSFNGHTQVNATDLRQILYPNRTTLERLGKWFMSCSSCNQETIDEKVNSLQ